MRKRNLLLSLLLAPSLLWAQDQEVKLTTSRAAGQTLTMQVNRTRDGVTVDWGDGNAVSYPRTDDVLCTITGTVKGADIVLRGGSALNTLICEGGDITAATLSGAKEMRSLYLQNNKLTSIDLTSLSKLVDLDLSGNQITTLALSESKNPLLENVNLANNGMEKIGSSTAFSCRTAALQHVNVSGNKFKNVYTTANPNLDALFCAGNQIEKLDVSRSPLISALVCNDNAITRITLPASGLEELQQMVCDNNAIASLDLSASKKLVDLSCSNNGMSSLLYPSLKLNSFACGGNALTFRALPSAANQPAEGYFSYLPQADLDVTSLLTKSTTYDGYYLPQCPDYASRNTTQYILDMSEYRNDASGRALVTFAAVEVVGDAERELTVARAADPNQDYTQTQGRFTFLKPFGRVRVLMTHKDYPGLTIRTSTFVIGEENITSIDAMELQPATQVGTAFDLQGRQVRNPQRGIYIQHGKKVLF